MRISREDIAVTGLSCRFAGSPDLESFWRNIMEGQKLFTPIDGLGPGSDLYDLRETLFGRPLPTYAAVLGEHYACNPADQHIPRELDAGENQDVFFAVQLVIDALRDSGTSLSSLPTDRISLRLGYAPPFNCASVNWLQHTVFLEQTVDIIKGLFPGATPEQFEQIRRKLASSLPAPNPYAFLSAISFTLASWTAHMLGFAGPALVIDAGAVSAHQSLQLAIDDLNAHRSDIAIAGAVQPPLSTALLHGLSGAMTFSRRDYLSPFSRESDGTIPGEGGAVFVLKRLKDAIRHQDAIYAVVRSTGVAAASINQQQRSPSPQRVARAINRALQRSHTTPEDITLIEAHGSGVPKTDMVESDVLHEIFGSRDANLPMIGVGTVKGNLGHTLWAAGAASLLKAILALRHRVLPPNVPIEKPFTKLCSGSSALYLINDARPWISSGKKALRRACVTAMDFTGTTAAAIIEEFPERS